MADLPLIPVDRVAAGERSSTSETDDSEFLSIARDRFVLAAEAENALRLRMLDDLEFYAGQQWPEEIIQQRLQDKRPCLTVNRLPQFVHQVTNEIRQNKPAPRVSPVDGQGDIETAEIFQGILRHIERLSEADDVRSYASFYQVICGRGYYRILTKYCSPMSFDQDLIIERIKNPMMVYFDPSAQEPDYSDAKWAFIVQDLTEEAYEAQFPGLEPSGAGEEFRSVGDDDPVWRYEGGYRIAEYFTRDIQQVEIALLSDMSVVPLEQVPMGAQVIATRTTEVPTVTWSTINGARVLDRRPWPGRWIPIIPVLGEEIDVDGVTDLIGMVRNAKDPQRMLNYWESAKTETIALAPRVPYIVAEGQIENHETEWQLANFRNFAYIQYKPKAIGDQLVPAPQRQVYEPPIVAITAAEAGAVDHLKATTGIYDASLGNRSNETSGIGIRARQMESDTSNFHYIDNLNIAITFEARQLVDLIPKIYDRPGRIVRIIGEDGTERAVTLNQRYNEKGLEKFYDLNAGEYDVAVSVGPSYATKRQEAADSMTAFAQVAPALVPQFADLYVKAMDWPGAQEIADRLRPPGVESDGEEQPVPPAVQQQMAQMAQMNEQLTIALNETTQKLEGKQLDNESKERIAAADNETKERIAAMQAQVDLAMKNAELGSKDAIALLQAELLAIRQQFDMMQNANAALAQAEARPEPVAPPPVTGRPPLESFESQDDAAL
jgi:hypothetical protein